MLVHITNRKPENQYIITITLNVSQFGVHKAASIALLNSPPKTPSLISSLCPKG